MILLKPSFVDQWACWAYLQEGLLTGAWVTTPNRCITERSQFSMVEDFLPTAHMESLYQLTLHLHVLSPATTPDTMSIG